MTAEKILVMGVGNPLMRDEGAGPRTVELLMNGYEFPGHVEIVDAGTMGLTILDLIRDVRHLIVVDAVQGTGHPAGTVLLMEPEEMADNQVMHSLHDLRISDVLQNARLIGRAPETVIVGVQIESIEEWVLELSPRVAAALPLAAAAVLEQLARLGVEPLSRDTSDINGRIIEAVRTFEPISESDVRPAAADRS